MHVNGRIFLLLCFEALEILSDHAPWTRIPYQSYDYSWLATMEYGYNTYKYEYCGGAVINTQFVLTAAQCVTGKRVRDMGGLTGVGLGNYCAYGTAYCSLRFGIAEIKLHANNKYTVSNGIALVRLNKNIIFGPNMKRVYLRLKTQPPASNSQLAVPGHYLPLTKLNHIRKINMMWAGVHVTPIDNVETAKGYKSERRMLLEGIVNFYEPSSCGHQYFCYVRLDKHLRWIEQHSAINSGSDILESKEFPKDSTTNPQGQKHVGTAVHQFPTDCGYSPIYPRELIDSGFKIEPDEFSWLASLVYEKNDGVFGHCSGSVISAHYVLTTRKCVQHDTQLGWPIGVRLGVFDKKFHCDYGTKRCEQYQYFRIAGIRVAPNPKRTKNNLALLKLDRDIKFGPKMKPICLPFDETYIPPPFEDSFLTVAGWWTTTYPNDVIAKRSAAVAFWNTTSCVKARLDKERQVCGVKPGTSPCTVELGSPLMNMFERRRMVLEAIAYDKVADCPGTDMGTLYTRVRSFKPWIEDSIRELETRSQNGQIPNTKKADSYINKSGKPKGEPVNPIANNLRIQKTDNRYNYHRTF